MNFTIGDVVMLKSGGPQMTVQSVQNDGSFWCLWFNRNGNEYETKGAAFKGAMLDKIE